MTRQEFLNKYFYEEDGVYFPNDGIALQYNNDWLSISEDGETINVWGDEQGFYPIDEQLLEEVTIFQQVEQ